MKQRLLNLVVTALLAMSYIGCGGGGSSASSGGTTDVERTVTGTVVDGLIKQATVCLDINKNGLCDSTEPTAITDSNGAFSLTTDVVGEYAIIASGGIDTATNQYFDGVLQEIVTLEADKNTTSSNVTPLTTISAIVYQDEKESNSSLTISSVKQTIASNLGLSEADISKNPLLDKNLFATTQKVVQTVKLLSTSIQKDTTSRSVNQDAFKTVIDQVAKTIKEDTTSKDINVSKVATNLEATQYKNSAISIPSAVVTSTQSYVDEVEEKIKETTSTSDLTSIQNGLETYSTQLQTVISSPNPTEESLTTITDAVKSTTTTTIITCIPANS